MKFSTSAHTTIVVNSERSEISPTLRIYPESAEPIFANAESRRFPVSAKVYFIERRNHGKNIRIRQGFQHGAEP